MTDPQPAAPALSLAEQVQDVVQRLGLAKVSIDAAIQDTQTIAKGSIEFRVAVRELLQGTTFAEPKGNDVEGLYGRLRAALERLQTLEQRLAHIEMLANGAVAFEAVDWRSEMRHIAAVAAGSEVVI